MRWARAFSKILSYRRIFFWWSESLLVTCCMVWSSSTKLHSLDIKLNATCGFKPQSKDELGWISVGKIIRISRDFLRAKSWVMFVQNFVCVELFLFLAMFDVTFFDHFNQDLNNKAEWPHRWILIFLPLIWSLSKNIIKWIPIFGCTKIICLNPWITFFSWIIAESYGNLKPYGYQ